MRSAQGIAFDVRPSATLTRLAAIVVALAAAAPLFTALPWYVRWSLAVVIVSHGALRLASFRRPPVLGLAWATDGVWTVTLHGGVDKLASLTRARIFGTAVFLSFRWPGGAGHLALLADNMPKDTLRMLRARLSTHNPTYPG